MPGMGAGPTVDIYVAIAMTYQTFGSPQEIIQADAKADFLDNL